MNNRPDGLTANEVLFEMPSDQRGAKAIRDALDHLPDDFWIATKAEAKWKEPYKHHPLFLNIEIYKARYGGKDCWLLLKQHDFIGYYMSEIFVISQNFGEQLIKKHVGRWRLKSLNTFAGESYDLAGEYDDERSAREAAQKRLYHLEEVQPTRHSGGQADEGIQDRVYIVRPDGTSYRFTG